VIELASNYGGGIAVRKDSEHHLIPEQGVYRLKHPAYFTYDGSRQTCADNATRKPGRATVAFSGSGIVPGK